MEHTGLVVTAANCTIPGETLGFEAVDLVRPKSWRFSIRVISSSLNLGSLIVALLTPQSLILGTLLLTACAAVWAQSPTVETLLRSGQAALDADDYARATASFERARQIAPDNPQANRGLVLSLLQLGRLSEAAQIGEKAVARWPRDAQLQHWLGLAYFKAGQNAAA